MLIYKGNLHTKNGPLLDGENCVSPKPDGDIRTDFCNHRVASLLIINKHKLIFQREIETKTIMSSGRVEKNKQVYPYKLGFSPLGK